MKRILILCTPRTGSNLLLNSLAQHHDAVTGGEYLSDDRLTHNSPEAIENIKSGAECNLFKAFAADYGLPGFDELYQSCDLTIHLYRRNITAQCDSWEKACKTGDWVKNQTDPLPKEVPSDMRDEIHRSRSLLCALADISICYESMVDHWDATIRYILDVAGWPLVTLPMATERQSEP